MIKGLMPGLAEAGKIKIGIKGQEVTSKAGTTFRMPEKIDHFRIVKNERDENDNYIQDDKTLDIIKKGGKAVYDSKDNLVGIPIRMLYNDLSMCFPTQYVSYVNGKNSCSGDGSKAKTRDGRSVACPCSRLANDYKGKDKCKIFATLNCVIEGTNIGSCFKFRTTSINSARFILSSLMLIKACAGGLLAFLPLRLVVNPKKTIIPTTGQPTTIYVVSLEYPGGIEELQKEAIKMGQERTSLITNFRDIEDEARRIVSPAEAEREEFDIATEFYPDSIELKTEPANLAAAEIPIVEPAVAITPVVEPAAATEPAVAEVTNEKIEPTKEDSDKKTTGSKKSTTKSKQETPAKEAKVTREQLEVILKLKSKLKVEDQKVWAKLVKKMRFKDVTKANDMTSEQGNRFIDFLKEEVAILQDIPF